ncbi:MAG: hypothetical protein ACM3SY_21115 [Candidatus Omnitrophota bacterium]
MGFEKLQKLIDEILDERRDRVYEKIDRITNNIILQLEELKALDDFHEYTIPENFRMEDKPKTEPSVDILHPYIKQISSSANQLDLINNFLEGINRFCTRAALFLLRDDKLVGWKGSGFSAREGNIGDDEIKKLFFSLSANTIFRYVLDKRIPYSGAPLSQPDDHILYSRFGGEEPEKIFALPFFVKGKPQAVVYTDTFDEKPIGEKEIEILATVAEMSLDLLPLRQKILAKIKTQEYPEESDSAQFHAYSPEPEERTPAPVKENDPERLARVIINDIYLYNKAKIDDIVRTGQNLFQFLQTTILQSRELYLNKYRDIAPFERQLIETLARGKKELLKGYAFETQ